MFTVLPITKEMIALYQPLYKKHTLIGWLQEENNTHLIVKMKRGYKGWTPYLCARDCGDHYIIARYDHYDYIDKKTFTITKDVEDK